MIGASKLNKIDVLKIKKLVNDGLNDCEIARQFIPDSGEPVTREHIRAIRIGKRWNDVNHSFIMKDDLRDLPLLKTDINGIEDSRLYPNCFRILSVCPLTKSS